MEVDVSIRLNLQKQAEGQIWLQSIVCWILVDDIGHMFRTQCMSEHKPYTLEEVHRYCEKTPFIQQVFIELDTKLEDQQTK